jgi:hypothetical protein
MDLRQTPIPSRGRIPLRPFGAPLVLLLAATLGSSTAQERAPGAGSLVGYWKLTGDCRDSSGRGNHGANHGADLRTGAFDGRSAFVEVPDAPSLRLGSGAFSLAA